MFKKITFISIFAISISAIPASAATPCSSNSDCNQQAGESCKGWGFSAPGKLGFCEAGNTTYRSAGGAFGFIRAVATAVATAAGNLFTTSTITPNAGALRAGTKPVQTPPPGMVYLAVPPTQPTDDIYPCDTKPTTKATLDCALPNEESWEYRNGERYTVCGPKKDEKSEDNNKPKTGGSVCAYPPSCNAYRADEDGGTTFDSPVCKRETKAMLDSGKCNNPV